MKFLLPMLALLLSVNASAGTLRVNCKFQDYQLINGALNSSRLLGKAEDAKELKAMLTEEMGPQCHQLVSDQPFATIPGSEISLYEISSGDRRFEVSVSVNRVTSSGNFISIKR